VSLREEIVQEIRSAFAGVTLDGGISLEQTRVMDNYGRGVTPEQFRDLPKKEVTDDWAGIPNETLDEADCTAFLDEKGFRYYIPALMIRMLDAYDEGSMMTIGTISRLYPKRKDHEELYSGLTRPQKIAIARYLQELPGLVKLQGEGRTRVERALRNYWFQFLPDKK
jgi:hypothetical protein